LYTIVWANGTNVAIRVEEAKWRNTNGCNRTSFWANDSCSGKMPLYRSVSCTVRW